ncbi:flagellar biosynthetic protein FliQ [bacterium]|nr:flagellar biosynthetic protein FliQ [bacterium]
MIENLMIKITTQGLLMVLVLSAPVILTSMVVGLTISVIQAITQIQEQTLSMVPKLFATFIVIALSGYWIASLMVRFTQNLFYSFPNYVH